MHDNPILILLVQIALILGLSRAVGMIFARFHQPVVIGEMIAGIMLGPSLFGWLAPETQQLIFPPDSVTYLNVLSQIGVIFFLFLIGLELDPKLIRNRGRAAFIISQVSIVAPLLLGIMLTIYLYPRVFATASNTRFTSAALFMGTAMSITAFPVLARILTERNLHKTQIGAITITCAAVNDATAWCLLAFVVAIAQAEGLRPAMITAGLAAGYVAFMFFIVRPFAQRLQIVYDRQGRLNPNIIAIIFIMIMASAFTTELIGIHALFGAFLLGAVMPKGTRFVRDLSQKLEDYTVIFLLPIFFVYAGLKTRIGLLNSAELWFYTALIIFVACAGKFGGSMLAARFCGLQWRESAAIGILMNTRGLLELVILTIGRDLGVISDAVFAMMVLMALVTTFLTTPILSWVYPSRLFGMEKKERDPAVPATFSILIPVSHPKSAKPLLHLAEFITGQGRTDRAISALYLRRPDEHEAYRAGFEDAKPADYEPLDALLAQAEADKILVEPISFVSRDAAADIRAVANVRQVDLILMGFHKPVIGRTMLGGTVHRVLADSVADVAIFVDRGFHGLRKILVPYLGGKHDRLAMELAARMARHAEARVTVLHVVSPTRDNGSPSLDAKGAVTRAFQDPAQPAEVELRVIEHASPVNAVLEQAKEFDLVVIGVAEEWGLESHLFGWQAERIARDCPTSLLIVRKHAKTRELDPLRASQGHRGDDEVNSKHE